MKNKNLKQKWDTIKTKAHAIIKTIAKDILWFIRIISALAFVLIPFLHRVIDKTLAQWIWYPCCGLFFLFAIMDCVKTKEPAYESPYVELFSKIESFVIGFVFVSIFVFNYYSITYIWLWVIFVLTFFFIPIVFTLLFESRKKNTQYTDEEKRVANTNLMKYIVLYWLLDFFYMAIFNNWLAFQLLFGILAVVIIFYNLTKAFLQGAKSLQFLLLPDFIFGLGVSAYLIYIIPNNSLQNIILTITAAVFGGIFTLVGVAWTFKKSDTDRQADLQRIENERKEEERKKHVPYINILLDTITDHYFDISIYNMLDISNPCQRKKLNNNVFYTARIEDFSIKNISSSNIIIKGLIINEKEYWVKNEMLLEVNSSCKIKTTGNSEIVLDHSIHHIGLITADILGNIYEIECAFKPEIGINKGPMKVTMKDGEKYTGFSFQYLIETVMLPKLISGEAGNE